MRTRRATPFDEERVATFRTLLWPDACFEEHRKEVHAILSGCPPSTLPLVIFVAEVDDELAGFIEVGLRSHADGCDPTRACGFVEGWFVDARFRRLGVGKALIGAAEVWSREQGASEIASDTWSDNQESQLAHLALGFEVVDRCVNYKKALLGAAPATPATPATRDEHYGPPLARVHHERFGGTARAAARELMTRLARAGIEGGTVVDLAAGSGLLSRHAIENGFHAWGADISEAMLAIARREVPAADFVQASLWEVELPRCVAVAAVGEAFNYRTDSAFGLRLERRLAQIHLALVDGGLLLFDVAGPGRSGATGSRRAFWNHPETPIGLEETEERSTHRLTRHLTLFTREADRFRRSEETHTLELYEPSDVERCLLALGFEVERLEGYDDFPLPESWYAFVATKLPSVSTRRT